MADESVLQMVLLEEYSRINRMIEGIQGELNGLPKGYISRKMIRGKESFYLQWREGDKIKSKYISKETAEDYKERIERRRSLEKSLRSNLKDKKRLEKALGQKVIRGKTE